MKFIKIVLSFFPFLAAAQADLQAVGGCLETKYAFYRQDVKEQEFTKNYDSQGRILKQISVFSSKNTGNYSEAFSYEYDAAGNNSTVTYQRNGEVKKITKKNFDATGKLTKESIASGANLLSVNSATANEKTQIFFGEDGKTETLKEISTFDAKGMLLKKEIKDPSGKVLVTDTKTYNLQGKITQETHLDAADKIMIQTDFDYDTKGNLLNDKTLRNDVVFAETKNEYDGAGKITKKTRLNGKGAVDYFFTYEYDKSGNMSKENYLYNNQIVSVRTFAYDAKGNKIKESYLDKIGKASMYKTWEFACK